MPASGATEAVKGDGVSRRSFGQIAVAGAVVLLVLAPALPGAAQPAPRTAPPAWKLQRPPLPPQIQDVGSLTCTNPSFCLSVGYNQTGDGLLTTINGGARWAYTAPPAGIGSFTSVDCFDADACLATTGPATTLFTSPSGAAASIDGGRTWTVDKTMPKPPGGGYWGPVACASATTCYVIERNASGYTTGGIEKTSDLGKTWTSEHVSGPDASHVNDLVALSCGSATSCVAVQQSNKGTGDVVYTTNGGSTWTLAQVPTGFKAFLDSISCVRATTDCMAAGSPGSTTAVITSQDSGKTWKATAAPGYKGPVSGVSCATLARCIAVGYLGSGLTNAGVAAFSTDFGKSWHVAPRTNIHGDLESVICPTATACTATRFSDGEVPGPAGSLGFSISKDGGATWSQSSVPLGIAELQEVACVTTEICTAVGGVTGPMDAGVVLRTDNGGATWAVQDYVAAVQSLSSVSCATTEACVAVGSFNYGSGDLIVYTHDAGKTWLSVKPPPLAAMLLDVDCPSATVCEVLGRTAHDDGNAVLRTTDGGAKWTQSRGPAFLDYGFQLSCPTTSLCYLVGDTAVNGGAIFVTTDGGLKWKEDSLAASVAIIQSVSCPSTTVCYAWSSGSVLTTTDGGKHWSSRLLSQQPFAISQSISCSSSTSCAVVSEQQPFSPSVAYVTTTAGKSWYQPKMPTGVGWLLGIDCTRGVCMSVGADGQIVRGAV
jgi:photosystem II stability/assembly factor-like uncharacterized protein